MKCWLAIMLSYHQDKTVMTSTNRKLLGSTSASWIFVAVPATALQQLQLLFWFLEVADLSNVPNMPRVTTFRPAIGLSISWTSSLPCAYKEVYQSHNLMNSLNWQHFFFDMCQLPRGWDASSTRHWWLSQDVNPRLLDAMCGQCFAMCQTPGHNPCASKRSLPGGAASHDQVQHFRFAPGFCTFLLFDGHLHVNHCQSPASSDSWSQLSPWGMQEVMKKPKDARVKDENDFEWLKQSKP